MGFVGVDVGCYAMPWCGVVYVVYTVFSSWRDREGGGGENRVCLCSFEREVLTE